jgi:signal transduction histidine kinase
MSLPEQLLAYTQTAFVDPRHPAYLLMNGEGSLLEWGGELSHYSLSSLARNEPVSAQLPFLEGLLPAETIPLELPSVEVAAGVYADLHILTGDRGDWILPLDATEAVHEQQKIQQKLNEINLRKTNNQSGTSSPTEIPWHAVFPTLNIAAMVRVDEHEFSLLSAPPSWLRKLWPGAVSLRERIRPGDVFSFLEYFLIEAETFWESSSSGQLGSGFWTEADQHGHEYQLEATATAVDDTKLLLISFPEQVFHDQQEILQKSREISLTHERTLQEIQKKDVLLHCIVHDLKSPLSTMKGVLDLLAAGIIKPERMESMIASGQQQADRQLGMIQDILTAFAAEMGALDSHSVRRVDAPDVVRCARSVADGLEPAYSRRNIRLVMGSRTEDAADWPVVGEESRLERIFTNLLENALRHTAEGTAVTIDFSRKNGTILTTIEDEGPGIPEGLVDRLFEKFSQGEQGGSTGLGLYFCRITVERWGGAIGAQNRDEGGARFWFDLPEPAN